MLAAPDGAARGGWDSDSGGRPFSPGLRAMRRLGRSVSRSTKRLLLPGRSGRAPRDEPHGPTTPGSASAAAPGTHGAGSPRVAGNGYLAYEFGDGDGGGDGDDDGDDDGDGDGEPRRRGPPLPSGIHRRSVSFDNLVVLADTQSRRSTQPSAGTPRSPTSLGLPLSPALAWSRNSNSDSLWPESPSATRKRWAADPPPSASTRDSVATAGKVAAKAAGAVNADTNSGNEDSLRLAYPDASMRRRWLAGLAHPLSTTIDTTEPHAQAPPADMHDRAAAINVPEAQIRFEDTATRGGGAARSAGGMRWRARYHERESFSGPVHLDAGANLTDSQNSAPSTSDPFQSRHAWQGEGVPGGPAQHSAPGERVRPHTSTELRRVARRPSAQQTSGGGSSSGGSGSGGSGGGGGSPAHHQQQQRRASHGDRAEIVPSAPIASGLFRRSSARAQERPAREPSQKLRGIARAIGNISRKLTRIRSNRSASQPATPNEVRQSILGSARRNRVPVPDGAGGELYQFFVNPEDPVSDPEEPRSDSPIVYNLSSGRSKHRRSPTFPSQSFSQLRSAAVAEPRAPATREAGGRAADQAAQAIHPGSLGLLASNAGSPSNTGSLSIVQSAEYLTPEEQASGSTDGQRQFTTASQRSLENVASAQPADTVAFVPPQGARTHQRSRSDCTEPAPGHTRDPLPRVTNQGHDGSLSALVQEKLTSDFGRNVRVSTRLAMSGDVRTESSYGTFIRFHNSGELNGISISGAGLRPPGTRASRDGHEEASTVSRVTSSVNPPILSPIAHSKGDDYTAVCMVPASTCGSGTEPDPEPEPLNRYMRNQDSIRRFVDEMRAARAGSDQRRSEAEELRRVQHSQQAGLDAALYIIERQRREEAGAGPQHQPELQQGRDVPTQSTASAGSLVHTSATVSTFGHADSCIAISRITIGRITIGCPDAECLGGAAEERVHFGAGGLMKRSQSLSHFAQSRPVGAANGGGARYIRRRTRNDVELGSPCAQQASQPRGRPGFLAGVLSIFTGGHDRRKSSGAVEANGHGAGQRKLARRPPRLSEAPTRAGAAVDIVDAAAGHSASAPLSNNRSDEPAGPLPTEAQVSTAKCAAGAPSASSQLQISLCASASLDSAGDDSLDSDNANEVVLSELGSSEASGIFVSMGLVASNVGSSRSIGRERQTRAAASSVPDRRGSSGNSSYLTQPSQTGAPAAPLTALRRDEESIGSDNDSDHWRDSAVTGLMAHVSASTPAKQTATTPEPAPVAADQPFVDNNVRNRAHGLGLYGNASAFRPHGAGRGRTSSVALDTITARSRGRAERSATRHSERVPRSLHNSRGASGAPSSDGSFADMIASADPEHIRHYRLLGLPGLESPTYTPMSGATSPTPPSTGGRRRLEEAVLFGGLGVRPMSAALSTPYDSPASEAETGRTQILGFSTTNLNDDGSPDAKCVRPSARPEIMDVRGIGWDGSSKELAVAIHAGASAAAKYSSHDSFDSSEAGAAQVLAAMSGLSITGAQALGSADVQNSGGAAAHDPQHLAMLVQRSPDPRTLIYDAGSQFGTMHSRKAATGPPRTAEAITGNDADLPEARSPAGQGGKMREVIGAGASCQADRSMAWSPPSNSAAHRVADGLREPLELHLLVAATESEAVARASIQATPSASPAVAAQVVQGSAASNAVPAAAAGATQSESGCAQSQARLSFQSYVAQQRLALRTAGSGQEQREFRVSLLGRKVPAHGNRTRSWSLPEPRPALQALAVNRRPSVGAGEDLEDAALFSHLLGDGAALTSPDVKVARRQSGALPAGQAPALAFDPATDTGDDGVPDSVLRAYVAGDITAIERFFEHIMRLTAPSSVYGSEASEDGDWSFGIEGPPPEILAQRAAAAAAARQHLGDASRELPDMIDVSAGASHAIESGADLQDTPEPTPSGNDGRGPEAVAAEDPAEIAVDAPAETPVAPGPGSISEPVPASTKAGRRIAVPRSRLSQVKPQGRRSSRAASPPPAASSTPAAAANDHAVLVAEADGPSVAELAEAAADAAAAAALAVDLCVYVEEAASPAVDSATCISPGRGRSHNIRCQASYAGRRLPLPADHSGLKGRDKQLLMARLRVLETMVQKSAIASSRPQPPPVLRQSRLTEDTRSVELGHSTAGELNYDRIRRELDSYSAAGGAAPTARRPAAAADNRVEVLRRLRRGSQARTRVPFRAGILDRAAVSLGSSTPDETGQGPERQWSSQMAEPPTSTSIPGEARDAVLPSNAAAMEYSVGSGRSIHVDIVDEASISESSVADITVLRQAVRLAATDRFRRTTKLLAL
ncbi:hypothetical protein LPJ61_001190 [Coemansia biformis]|uniref:Uncharacterized protein n=1 Tax=Coemansia biformis TaxID=1286918 RepID=A0A9W8CYC7_9FUNG|nr:hypothetical protein LPJ61_001190 [Coemansia biformis]